MSTILRRILFAGSVCARGEYKGIFPPTPNAIEWQTANFPPEQGKKESNQFNWCSHSHAIRPTTESRIAAHPHKPPFPFHFCLSLCLLRSAAIETIAEDWKLSIRFTHYSCLANEWSGRSGKSKNHKGIQDNCSEFLFRFSGGNRSFVGQRSDVCVCVCARQ